MIVNTRKVAFKRLSSSNVEISLESIFGEKCDTILFSAEFEALAKTVLNDGASPWYDDLSYKVRAWAHGFEILRIGSGIRGAVDENVTEGSYKIQRFVCPLKDMLEQNHIAEFLDGTLNEIVIDRFPMAMYRVEAAPKVYVSDASGLGGANWDEVVARLYGIARNASDGQTVEVEIRLEQYDSDGKPMAVFCVIDGSKTIINGGIVWNETAKKWEMHT